MDREQTLGERLAAQARALRARRTVVPGWLNALAPVLDREGALPVPEASPRHRVEARVPPVGYEQTPQWPGWPAAVPGPQGGRGRPLRGDLRERLTPVTGPVADRVRIHDDEHAGRIAAAYGADAVTIGEEIFLGSRASAGPEDLALLAHEVWHATEPGRTGGAPHRATSRGAAEEERVALAVEHMFLDGVPGTPSTVSYPATPGWSPPPPTPPVSATPSQPAAPAPAAAPVAQPMAARPGRHAETPTAALDPGALRAMVQEVLRGELRDQAARQIRADLAIELERGA
ncbi:eCIS core domain-containing protein [Acrocarpospora catenulata]|uniref:eCIS core domain-containing protein n=1 Tax=Acrocarpospora catenulata TaxID=2836182 RepID=UPI001BDB2D17|nr:DUF4157 domain-containing protein [Acrocarpospora catenulata]